MLVTIFIETRDRILYQILWVTGIWPKHLCIKLIAPQFLRLQTLQTFNKEIL